MARVAISRPSGDAAVAIMRNDGNRGQASRCEELAVQIEALSMNVRAMAEELRIFDLPERPVSLRNPPVPLRRDASDITYPDAAAIAGKQDLANLARRYLRLRRFRDTIFPPDMFADAAWDLLLDLYAAEAEQGLTSISSACIAAAVPPSTALRCINGLVAKGFVVRRDDPFDRRRAYVQLAPEIAGAVGQWLTAMFGAINARPR